MSRPSVSQSCDHRGVLSVCVQRAEKRNAFDDAVIAALLEIFTAAASDRSLRALVLRSEGEVFCAGADLQWMQRMVNYSYADNVTDATHLADMLNALYALPIPTLCRVQGPALGGGVGLLCCCDFVVASTTAYFSFSEVKLGLIPATIAPYVLLAIGERAARRYFLSGERIDCNEAKILQLVTHLCEPVQLDDALETLLQQLLQCGPRAQRASKDLLAEIHSVNNAEALRLLTSERIAAQRISAEGQAGLRAFLEKRPMPWLPQEQ